MTTTGPFRNRKALLKVPRLGPKAFEQCAGFLRIRGGDDPIDASGVHPEAYPVVRRILDRSGVTLAELIGDERSLRALRPADFADDRFGIPTVTDILAELEKPGRDPRPAFSTATFAAGVEKVADLKVGMVLEGVVTNVAAFGAFVDVGVHQDGLVHVSAMADRFVSDPHEVVRSGQVVRVKVARCRRGTPADRAESASQRHTAIHHGGLVHGLGALLSRHLLPPLVQLPGLAAALRAGAPPISDPVVRHACGRCERVHDRSRAEGWARSVFSRRPPDGGNSVLRERAASIG